MRSKVRGFYGVFSLCATPGIANSTIMRHAQGYDTRAADGRVIWITVKASWQQQTMRHVRLYGQLACFVMLARVRPLFVWFPWLSTSSVGRMTESKDWTHELITQLSRLQRFRRLERCCWRTAEEKQLTNNVTRPRHQRSAGPHSQKTSHRDLWRNYGSGKWFSTDESSFHTWMAWFISTKSFEA
jgi:hypothetical protein